MSGAGAESFYFERQALPDSCRMHAVNAVLGRQVFTWAQFLQMCDMFDDFAQQPRGTSRVFFFAGTDLTLFGFALRHANSNKVTVPVCGFSGRPGPPAPAHLLSGAVAAFVYTQGHVWAARKCARTGQWFTIDSLSGIHPSPGFERDVAHRGLGLELVFEDQHTSHVPKPVATASVAAAPSTAGAPSVVIAATTPPAKPSPASQASSPRPKQEALAPVFLFPPALASPQLQTGLDALARHQSCAPAVSSLPHIPGPHALEACHPVVPPPARAARPAAPDLRSPMAQRASSFLKSPLAQHSQRYTGLRRVTLRPF